MKLTNKEVLHFGTIISLKISRNKSKYLRADGFGSDRVLFEDLHADSSLVFSRSLFLVLPIFENIQKYSINDLEKQLRGQNLDSKKQRCSKLLKDLYREYASNIEVADSNLSTPLKFNLIPFHLYHVNSSKFLSLTDASLGVENIRLCLVDSPTHLTQFRFSNSLKYQVEGECLVFFNTPLKLMASVEIRGFCPKLSCPLNTSGNEIEPIFSIENDTDIEVEFFKTEIDEIRGELLRGGDLIVISQLDRGMVLSVNNDISNNIHDFWNKGKTTALDEVEINLTSFSSKDFIDSIVLTHSLWVVEHLEKASGEVLRWKDPIRLMNMVTGKYLCDSVEKERKGRNFFVADLNAIKANVNSIYRFLSSTEDNPEFPIPANEYVSIQGEKFKRFLGIQEGEEGDGCQISSERIDLNENTFKIVRSDKYNNEISYFQLSVFASLSGLLYDLRRFRLKRAYHHTQDLRKKILLSVKTIWKLKSFISNKFLISNIKEKFSQRNPARQDFVANQHHILFLSLILSTIFDQHELVLIQDSDKKSGEFPGLWEVVNNKVSYKEMMEEAEFRYKAANRLTKEDLNENFSLLLKAKVYFANQIYELLGEICKNSEKNARIAFSCGIYFMNQFAAIPRCSSLVCGLISSSEQNAMNLRKNINFTRIIDSVPTEDFIELDIVITDPNDLLVSDFKRIKVDLLREQIGSNSKKRLVNPLVYAFVLASKVPNPQVKVKCLELLSASCEVEGQPFSLAQDVIYKIMNSVPDLWTCVFGDLGVK